MVVGPDHMVNATEAYTADGSVQRKTRPIEIGGVKTVADIGLNASPRKGNTTKVTRGLTDRLATLLPAATMSVTGR